MSIDTASSLRNQLRICWGSFDSRGNWRPNPYIDMAFEQQRAENIEAGFMDEQGKRTAQQNAIYLQGL